MTLSGSVAGTTRTRAKAMDFAAKHGIRMLDTYEAVLADGDIDAVVLGKLLHVEGNFCGPSAYRSAASTGATIATKFRRAG